MPDADSETAATDEAGHDGSDRGHGDQDDGGPHAGSLRRCAVSRALLTPDALIRFVADPSDQLVPDIRRKLPGRGVWVALSRAAVDLAVRRKVLARGLKRQVTVPSDLGAKVDALLVRDALQAMAMANKAGLVVTGFSKVEASIAGGRCAALVEATDGAADGRRKLGQALRRVGRDDPAVTPIIDCFASSDLELALGRELVIHASLLQGAATEACLGRWRRLMFFRTSAVPDHAVSGLPAADLVTARVAETEPETR